MIINPSICRNAIRMQLVQPKFRVCAKFSNLEISRFFELFKILSYLVPWLRAKLKLTTNSYFRAKKDV